MMEIPNVADEMLWQTGRKVKVRIALGGDFLPAMALYGVSSRRWHQNANKLKSYFTDIDCAVVNLECPLECKGLPAIPKLGTGASLFGSKETLNYLKALEICTVSIANNHIMDFGPEGILRTQEALFSAGIEFLGAPVCMREEPEIKIVDLHDVKIGLWAAFLNAERKGHGAAGIEAATAVRSRKALLKMKEEVSCRIALIHAGLEKTNYPDPYELKALHAFIEDGFDLVCVCHSHRISGYATVWPKGSSRPGYCFHGLGSILSGCIYGDLEREGIVVVLGLDTHGKPAELSVRPIWLEGLGWGSVPDQAKRQLIMDRFHAVSQKIENGSFSEEFYVDVGQDLGRRFFRDMNLAFKHHGLKGIAAKLSRIRPKHLSRLLNKVF